MSNKSLFSDPIALLVVLVVGFVLAVMLILFAAIVVLPFAIIAVAAFFAYRHYKLAKLRSPTNVPDTVKERTEYLTLEQFSLGISERTLLNRIEEDTDLYSCQSLSDAFNQLAIQLYAQESFHQPPRQPVTNDRITLSRYYDQLEAWQRKVSDISNNDTFYGVLGQAYLTLRKYFPRYALSPFPNELPSKLSARLQIANEDEATKDLIGIFFDQELKDRRLFEELRRQIEANDSEDEGFPFYQYFAHTPFSVFRRVSVPIHLPDETRFAGMWVLAPQGRGKTTLLHSMVAQDIEKDASIILMDSKGDLIEPFLQLASIRDRLIVVGPDNPVGLNPLDIPHGDINKAVDNLEYLFSSLLEFKLTGTQSMLLRAVLRALVSSFEQPTLETFRDILANGVKPYPQQIQSLQPDLRDFFTKEFETENIKHRRQEVLQRLRLLLDNDVMKEMLLAPFTTFHIGEAMDDGKIIIIDNSKGKLGEQAAEFFGRFFIAQVLAAAQQRSFRPANTKRPVYFYIDEAHSVIARDEKITTVLHECRAQKIALILAHQEMVQLSDKVLSAVQNCAIRFANPDEEAPKLVRTLRTDIDQLRALKQGQFAAYIRDFSASGLIVDVEQTDFSSLPQLPPPKPVRQIAAQVIVTEPAVPESDSGAAPASDPAPAPAPPPTADPGEPAPNW